jgi:ADP-ribosyl-[dinitrogen reductase] hydrolase
MTGPSPNQRLQGGLYGSLVGDALGVPVEFQNRAKRQQDPVTSMRAFGTWNQPAGTWSDDGSLLLCAVESLAERGFDTQDMGERFVRWLQEGHWAAHGRVFDIGHATHQALDRIALGTPAEQAGGQSESSNGNGSLMRLLPVPLATLTADLDTFCDQIERASAITHGHARSKLACVLHGLLVRALMQGENPAAAHASAASEFQRRYADHTEYPHFLPLLDPNLDQQHESSIASTGYVLHTLHAALWCLLTTGSFEECVLKAVNLGDDTDTTGCVAGGLAGVVHGVEAIPEAWLTVLPQQSNLQNLFRTFIHRVFLSGEKGGCGFGEAAGFSKEVGIWGVGRA